MRKEGKKVKEGARDVAVSFLSHLRSVHTGPGFNLH